MKITDEIETLEPKVLNLTGVWSVISPVLIRENGYALLTDACYPEQLVQIREAIEGAGLEILSHAGEVPYIQGELPPLKQARSDRPSTGPF